MDRLGYFFRMVRKSQGFLLSTLSEQLLTHMTAGTSQSVSVAALDFFERGSAPQGRKCGDLPIRKFLACLDICSIEPERFFRFLRTYELRQGMVSSSDVDQLCVDQYRTYLVDKFGSDSPLMALINEDKRSQLQGVVVDLFERPYRFLREGLHAESGLDETIRPPGYDDSMPGVDFRNESCHLISLSFDDKVQDHKQLPLGRFADHISSTYIRARILPSLRKKEVQCMRLSADRVLGALRSMGNKKSVEQLLLTELQALVAKAATVLQIVGVDHVLRHGQDSPRVIQTADIIRKTIQNSAVRTKTLAVVFAHHLLLKRSMPTKQRKASTWDEVEDSFEGIPLLDSASPSDFCMEKIPIPRALDWQGTTSRSWLRDHIRYRLRSFVPSQLSDGEGKDIRDAIAKEIHRTMDKLFTRDRRRMLTEEEWELLDDTIVREYLARRLA